MHPTAIALLLACTPAHDDAPAPTAAAVAEAPPIAEAATPEVAPAPPPVEASPARFPTPSAWSSAACEGRTYERQIRFEGERWFAKDLVAPCPPGTLCVWSGILDRQGSFSLDRRQLRLLPDSDAPQPPMATNYPLPSHLWLADDGTLTEDEGRCPYLMVP